MLSLYRPSSNGRADRFPMLGVALLWNATTNKPGAINPNNFCLLGLFFLKNYYSGLFHHLHTGLSNGGHIKNGRMAVRSVSVHSSANAVSGARTALQIQAFVTPSLRRADALHRHWLQRQATSL